MSVGEYVPEWVEYRPSARMLAWARSRQAQGDEAKPNDMRNVASLEKRSRGFVAEGCLELWLREKGVPYVHNGGCDPLPDFEIAGRRIGVRLSAVNGRFRPHHLIYVFARHVGTVDGWFFCAVQMGDPDRYFLLGGIERERFLADARFVDSGGLVCRGFVAQHPLHVQPASVLVPPDDWLRGLSGLA